MGPVHLWAEMAEENSWPVWTDENGVNEDFEVFHHFLR